MRFLAHELRADHGDLCRRDLLRQWHMTDVLKWFSGEGSITMDAPAATSTEQLIWMAGGLGTEEERKENQERWQKWAK